MDPQSVSLIIGAIAQGVGVAAQWAELAQRVRNGERITDAEIAQARAEIDVAIARWDSASEHDHE